MTQPVNFEIAKLLKEKSWSKPTLNFYFEDGESKENVLSQTTGMDYGSEFETEFSELIENWNDKWLTKKNGDRCFGCKKSKGYLETFSAPTIADVVMWLYEKHGIFVTVTIPYSEFGKFSAEIWGKESDNIKILLVDGMSVFNTINQAYEEGIIESLKLI